MTTFSERRAGEPRAEPRHSVPTELDFHVLRTGHQVLDSRVFVYCLNNAGDMVFGWPATKGQAELWLDRSEPNSNRAAVDAVESALHDWENGNPGALEGLAVAPQGTDFQVTMWDAMRNTHAGEVFSYAELAQRAGRPDAARAAGSACASNPVLLVVPCHRFLRSDTVREIRSGGAIDVGGYAAGPDVKRALLEFEAVAG